MTVRVALVSAPYDTNVFRIGENLGIKYLASALLASNVEVTVVEPALENLSNAEVAEELLRHSYDAVGFSIMFDEAVGNVSEIVADLRARGFRKHITVGGHVPTFNSKKILQTIPGIDTVVQYEAEETIVELLEALDAPHKWCSIKGLAYRGSDGVVSNSPRPLIAELDSIPFPMRDAYSRHLGDPHFFVVTSRGCPFVCTFCSIPAFYKTPPGSAWRTRSVENVLAELEYLVYEHEATSISFLDDEFLVGKRGKERARTLADAISQRYKGLTWSFECRADDVEQHLFKALQDGGLRHVFLGIESGVQRVLDTFDKRTTVEQNRNAIEIVRGLGLSLGVGFIMFDPYTTFDEMRQNITFLNAMKIGTYKAVANKLRVYAGTRMESLLAENGLLVEDDEFALEFKFKDARVGQAYELTYNRLRPLHVTDQECRRAEFRLDNLPDGCPSLPHLREKFSAIQRDANDLLAGLMTSIVSFFDEHGASGGGLAIFEREIDDRVTNAVDRLSATLDQLRLQTEAARDARS